MTDLEFTILDVIPEPYAATPNLLFKMRVTESSGTQIHAIALRAQVRIEPQRRHYADGEKDGLEDLFGGPERWGETLRPFLWTQTSTMLQGFNDSVEFDLPVTCTYDFEVTAAKYLQALTDGDIPVVLLFSGTVFSKTAGIFGVEQVPWHLEANYRLPVKVWRQLMDMYFPNSGWIRIDRDTLDALIRFKSSRGLLSWEQALGALLDLAPERAQ